MTMTYTPTIRWMESGRGMKTNFDSLAETLNSVIILSEDAWKPIILSMLSPYAPRPMLNSLEIRPNLHTMFAGDVSTAKSAVLNIVKKVATKWESISKATEPSMEGSAVGKDIKAGILERASGGLLVIPEFQSVFFQHVQVLREALDGAEIRIYKKGQERKFTPNVTMMTACNPKNDFFKNANLREQVTFKEGLLTRFDVLIPLIASADLNEKVLEKLTLFGESATGVDWGIMAKWFKRVSKRMKRVTQVTIADGHEEQLKEAFKRHNKRRLRGRPFLILRDMETLMRLVNVVTAFEARSTGVVTASDAQIAGAIGLWENLLTYRREFYLNQTRLVRSLSDEIYDVIEAGKGPVEVADVIEEICVSQQLCSPSTVYRKLQSLKRQGFIKHKKGHDATVEAVI